MNTKPTDNEHAPSMPVVVTTSWDDGHVDDVRLAELLKKHGIAGTFYISPENVELAYEERLNKEHLQHLARSFEIGAHTLSHRHLPTLSDEEAIRDIVGSKNSLEQITGRSVVSFCYPAGMYEPRHVLMVQNAGFRIARTVQRFIFNVEHPFECGTSIHTYDHWSDVWNLLRYVQWNPILFFKLYRRWDLQAIHMFDRVQKTGGVFHLWGHSWELARRDGWKRLENVLAYIAHKQGVSYLTNGELV